MNYTNVNNLRLGRKVWERPSRASPLKRALCYQQ